jgi:hypothetical protein
MAKKTKRKPPPQPAAENKDLKAISYRVNEFGEIVRDVKTEDINAYLDENVPDKKFTED